MARSMLLSMGAPTRPGVRCGRYAGWPLALLALLVVLPWTCGVLAEEGEAPPVEPEPPTESARVANIVFHDANRNGLQDEGEAGLLDVIVRLDIPETGEFPGFSAVCTTDSEGVCVFAVEGLLPAEGVVATVTVDQGEGAGAGLLVTTPNPQRTLPLSPEATDESLAFGMGATEVTASLCVQDALTRSEDCVDVPVLLSSSDPVEGFEIAVGHDAGLTLESITIAGTATEDNGADFASFAVLAEGGTAGVVMDLEEPFDNNTLPAGDDLTVALYRYCAPEVPEGEPPQVFALRMVNGEIGDPPKDNIVVVGGLSVSAEICEATITVSPREVLDDVCFYVGGPELDALNKPQEASGGLGDTVELSFYYTAPPPGGGVEGLQGLSMALAYDCRLDVLEESFRLPPGGILETLEADFIEFHADNDPQDGDDCDMVFAVLLESEPPFEGTSLPATDVPLKLASVDVRIDDDAPCGECLPVTFSSGVNGRGRVPIRNLYSLDNNSFPPCLVDTQVCVSGLELFRRGDCNIDVKVNTTDAVVILLYLFPWWGSGAGFSPPCFDACDADDTGRVDVTDAIYILNWLFLSGPEPPLPGPFEPGEDPTDDDLDCGVLTCD